MRAGEQLAECGNSGNSSEPHVHFQLMDTSRTAFAAGLPFRFDGYDMPRNEQPFVATVHAGGWLAAAARPAADILGLVIRRAEPRDLEQLARVHLAAFRAGNGPHVDANALSELTYERDVEEWRPVIEHPPIGAAIQVAEEDGRIIGLCSAGASRDEDGAGIGELYAIYVDPERWGNGTSVALEVAARKHLRERGFAEVTLWTLAGNTRARRFYEHHDWQADGSSKELMGGTAVRYRARL